MITEQEFKKLSADLRKLAVKIPLHWGAVQNNRFDGYMSENQFFNIKRYEELERTVASFPDNIKAYFRRRWYILECSKCDEYLFYVNHGVTPNPNPRDKSYDIAFDDGLKFDVKGTVIPRQMRSLVEIEQLLRDPSPMVKFYYDKQSHGRRFDMQNRLFVVHHSFIDEHREFYLRCAWGTKQKIYQEYCNNVHKIKFINYEGCTASVIFILEREKNKLTYSINGLSI